MTKPTTTKKPVKAGAKSTVVTPAKGNKKKRYYPPKAKIEKVKLPTVTEQAAIDSIRNEIKERAIEQEVERLKQPVAALFVAELPEEPTTIEKVTAFFKSIFRS